MRHHLSRAVITLLAGVLSTTALPACTSITDSAAGKSSAASSSATPPSGQAQDHGARAQQIAQLAAELRQGDPWPVIRKLKEEIA